MPNTREKLIELLNGAQHYGIICTMSQMDDRYASITQVSNTEVAERLIANGVTIQKWIPVTERLPEEDKDVLALCYWHESWQVQVCHLSSNWNGQWYTSIAGKWVIVSHWQYLPQPPKGE